MTTTTQTAHPSAFFVNQPIGKTYRQPLRPISEKKRKQQTIPLQGNTLQWLRKD